MKNTFRKEIVAIIIATGCSFALTAKEIYVATSGNDSSGDGSITKPYKTPAKALENAEANDNVILNNGEYSLSEPLMVNEGVTLRGVDEGGVILSAKMAGYRAIDLNGGTLHGLVITGFNTSDNGAGVQVSTKGGNIANVVVRDCTVTAPDMSTGNVKGGGIDCGDCSVNIDAVTVERCKITIPNTSNRDNLQIKGGGIYGGGDGIVNISNSTVRDCGIEFANESVYGGGIYIDGPNSGENASLISGCTIENCYLRTLTTTGANNASGGGVKLSGSSRMEDSLVSGCNGFNGSAVMMDAAASLTDCTLRNSDKTAVYINGANYNTARISRCEFTQNGNTKSSDASFNGGAIFVSKASLDVKECVFSGNSALNGGAVWIEDGGNCSFEKCIFKQNESILKAGAESGRGSAVANSNNAVLDEIKFSHCEFKNNHVTTVGGATTGGATVSVRANPLELLLDHANPEERLLVRNCLFVNNQGGASTLEVNASTPNVMVRTIEYCTFAGEGGVAPVTTTNGSNLLLIGNAFLDGGAFTADFVNNLALNFQNCLFAPTSAPTEKMDGSCVTLDEFDPGKLFSDAANGAWYPPSDQQFPGKDIGSSNREWTNDTAARDLGNGLVTEVSRTYGVKVNAASARKRKLGAAPDAGCFETDLDYGFQVIIR